MFGLLLALLILDGIFLTIIILLQSGKGGGLAAMGGGGGTMADSVIGGRQAATLLTKASWTLGGAFIVIALTLSVMSSRAAGPDSILRQEFQTTPLAPQPITPGTPLPGPGTPEGGAAPEQPPATPPTSGERPPGGN